MKRLTLAVVLIPILALLLTGCARHRWLEIESGEYTRVHGTDPAGHAARQVRSLAVDREASTVTLTLDDGSRIPLAFVVRPRADWPEGCPTNLLQYHMEILDLEESTLSIDSATLQEPVLVRNCPEDPFELVLREDGPIGGSGSASCDTCLVFSPADASAPEAAPSSLPHSAKGYELYSWQEPESGPWHYTLVTGTNRQKTAEELTTGDDTVTEDGWVKLTVTGAEALLDLLARLPPGEQLFWHGAVAAPAGPDADQFRLPDESAVATVEARCRELDLDLIVVAGELQALSALPDTVRAGGPVPLTFTLFNYTPDPLYILKWYTPLEGIAGEIFRVTRNRQILPYQGIQAMRGDPGPEDYVFLRPGGSVTATVDLAQAYDFSEAGTYDVTLLSPRISDVARTEAEMARTVDELGPVTIGSNTATLTVSPGE